MVVFGSYDYYILFRIHSLVKCYKVYPKKYRYKGKIWGQYHMYDGLVYRTTQRFHKTNLMLITKEPNFSCLLSRYLFCFSEMQTMKATVLSHISMNL